MNINIIFIIIKINLYYTQLIVIPQGYIIYYFSDHTVDYL